MSVAPHRWHAVHDGASEALIRRPNSNSSGERGASVPWARSHRTPPRGQTRVPRLGRDGNVERHDQAVRDRRAEELVPERHTSALTVLLFLRLAPSRAHSFAHSSRVGGGGELRRVGGARPAGRDARPRHRARSGKRPGVRVRGGGVAGPRTRPWASPPCSSLPLRSVRLNSASHWLGTLPRSATTFRVASNAYATAGRRRTRARVWRTRGGAMWSAGRGPPARTRWRPSPARRVD